MEMHLNPSYQCEFKEDEIRKRYISDPQRDKKVSHIMNAHRERNGCGKYFTNSKHYVDRFGFNSCFCGYQHPLIHYYIVLTDNYDKGVLPHSGSLSDQSAYVMDIIYLIRSIRLEHQEKLKKESKSKKR